MKYNQPHNETDPNASYKDFNLDTGEAGSIPPAIAIEAPQREIVAAITAAGLTPDPDDLTQLSQAIDVKITAGTGDKPSRSEAVLSATIRTLVVLSNQAAYDALTAEQKADPSVLYAIKG